MARNKKNKTITIAQTDTNEMIIDENVSEDDVPSKNAKQNRLCWTRLTLLNWIFAFLVRG